MNRAIDELKADNPKLALAIDRVVEEDTEYLCARAKYMADRARLAKPSKEVDEFAALLDSKLGGADDMRICLLRMTERDWKDLDVAFERIKK